jgi:hypothetical protein
VGAVQEMAFLDAPSGQIMSLSTATSSVILSLSHSRTVKERYQQLYNCIKHKQVSVVPQFDRVFCTRQISKMKTFLGVSFQ